MSELFPARHSHRPEAMTAVAPAARTVATTDTPRRISKCFYCGETITMATGTPELWYHDCTIRCAHGHPATPTPNPYAR